MQLPAPLEAQTVSMRGSPALLAPRAERIAGMISQRQIPPAAVGNVVD
jgi:hypothetical protein